MLLLYSSTRVAGHFKEQCPTNLDPSFDPKPTGGYQCYCCGAKEKHLTTLCPLNGNPDSVTQQRIRAGIPLMEPSSPPAEADRHRPSHTRSRKSKKTPPRSTDISSTRETYRARGQFEDDDGDRMDPTRRAWLERDDRGEYAPRLDDRIRDRKRRHYSPPRGNRDRGSSIDDPQRGRQAKRSRRRRRASRSGSRSSHGEREDSTELLPRMCHRSSGDGRLSYWDDGYHDIKTLDTVSPREARTFVSGMYQPSDSLEAEIKRFHPDADPTWVTEMAAFDVDVFLREVCGHIFAKTAELGDEHGPEDMVILNDGDNVSGLPTVRLPPSRGTVTDTISDIEGAGQNDFKQDDKDKTLV
jgi:hypothetical protein